MFCFQHIRLTRFQSGLNLLSTSNRKSLFLNEAVMSCSFARNMVGGHFFTYVADKRVVDSDVTCCTLLLWIFPWTADRNVEFSSLQYRFLKSERVLNLRGPLQGRPLAVHAAFLRVASRASVWSLYHFRCCFGAARAAECSCLETEHISALSSSGHSQGEGCHLLLASVLD